MSSMFCTKIYKCKNADWCARDFNPKSDEPECFEPLTNADRIRAMTDEELADFMLGVAQNGGIPTGGKIMRWLEWLKQEVEE